MCVYAGETDRSEVCILWSVPVLAEWKRKPELMNTKKCKFDLTCKLLCFATGIKISFAMRLNGVKTTFGDSKI